jgi:hypothetical protein
MVDYEIEELQQFVDDYQEISRVNTKVNGRQATIFIWDGTLPPKEKERTLQMYMLLDNVTWIVTCTPPKSEFSYWEEDFYHIINSFRYLK